MQTVERQEGEVTQNQLELIHSSTPREFFGITKPIFEEVGLSDCPMHILASADQNRSQYEVRLDTEPLDINRFLALMNYAAPSDYEQSASMIEGDWIYALDKKSNEYIWHSRFGEHWHDFVRRAPAYLDMVRSGDNNWHFVKDLDDFDGWVKGLPEPIPVDEDWFSSIAAVDTEQLLGELSQKGFVDTDKVLISLIRSTATSSLFDKGSKYHRLQKRLQQISQMSHDRQISAFAKLSRTHRELVQGCLLYFITGNTEYIPWDNEKPGFPTRYVIRPSDRDYRTLPDFRNVIDKNGIPSITSSYPSSLNIPQDYRSIENALEAKIQDEWGYYEGDGRVVDLCDPNRINKSSTDRAERFVDRSSIRQVKAAFMVPKIAWTKIKSADGTIEFSWDVGLDTDVEAKDGVTITTYRDGVLGLIAVSAFSDDIRNNKSLWREKRRLPKRQKHQEMGAAQLPLLVLITRHALAGSDFVNAVENRLNQ